MHRHREHLVNVIDDHGTLARAEHPRTVHLDMAARIDQDREQRGRRTVDVLLDADRGLGATQYPATMPDALPRVTARDMRAGGYTRVSPYTPAEPCACSDTGCHSFHVASRDS